MGPTRQKIFLTLARDTVTAGACLYVFLLILDAVIDGFVSAFVSLSYFGYVVGVSIIIYSWVKHRQNH